MENGCDNCLEKTLPVKHYLYGRMSVCILLLVLLDQTIKYVIYTWFLECRFMVVPGLVEFLPTFNTKNSYLGSLLYHHYELTVGRVVHLIVLFPVESLIVLFYLFLRNKFRDTRLLDIAFVFQLSGFICWLAGNFRTNGELDYLYLKPFFVFDLKDVYNNCFVVFWMCFCFKNGLQIRDIKMKELLCYLKTLFVWRKKE